jgi:predicted Rossmann fold nucleotide-binding protein DprA/Smf involved in DNA uptake
MAKTGLEERLEAVAREFVQRIVAEIRSASFAEVAGYAPQREEQAETPAAVRARAPRVTRVVASPKRSAGAASGGTSSGERQTAEKRAELSARVVEALQNAGEPISAKAIATVLEVSPELLAAPLLELRAAGRIAKHGEKRATTYSLP